jgi:integration host factor subunit beta
MFSLKVISSVKLSVDLFVDNMADALARGDRMEFQGLCSFSVKRYKAISVGIRKPGRRCQLKPRNYHFLRKGKS